MTGITINERTVDEYLDMEKSMEIVQLSKTENKVYIYKPPIMKLWSPYKGRSSKVRKIEVK